MAFLATVNKGCTDITFSTADTDSEYNTYNTEYRSNRLLLLNNVYVHFFKTISLGSSDKRYWDVIHLSPLQRSNLLQCAKKAENHVAILDFRLYKWRLVLDLSIGVVPQYLYPV